MWHHFENFQEFEKIISFFSNSLSYNILEKFKILKIQNGVSNIASQNMKWLDLDETQHSGVFEGSFWITNLNSKFMNLRYRINDGLPKSTKII